MTNVRHDWSDDDVRRALARVRKSDLGDRIRAARRSRGLSQLDVANAMELGASGQSHISAIERGRGAGCEMVARIIAILGADPSEILKPSESTLERYANALRMAGWRVEPPDEPEQTNPSGPKSAAPEPHDDT